MLSAKDNLLQLLGCKAIGRNSFNSLLGYLLEARFGLITSSTMVDLSIINIKLDI